MKLQDYVNMSELRDMIVNGYINVVHHHEFPLKMYSYTKDCHYEKMWNDTTCKCRGIIVDENDNIISRPFKKFFNYEEYDDNNWIDDLAHDFNPEIYEKLDGTLGILYWYNDVPYIATKGSFNSDQALHATNLLHTKYRHTWDKLLRTKTYLFEIIYPEDFHIVSYPDVDDIFLLAIISTNCNYEYPIEIAKDYFPIAKKYYCNDWKNIRNIVDGTNREGFVVRIGPHRFKMKYENYVKLHMEKYSFSDKKLFELVKNNDADSINHIMTLFEDEDRVHIQNSINAYRNEYNKIHQICKDEFKNEFATKKEAADYIKTCTYPHVLFAMISNNDLLSNELIWKCVKKKLKNNA